MSQGYSVTPRKTELAKHREGLLQTLIEGDQFAATRLVCQAISERWEPSHVYVHVIGHCLA